MRLIIILGALMVLILLGGAVTYMLVSGAEDSEEAVEEHVEEHAEEEEHHDDGGHGSSAPQPQYVKMEVLALPVVRGKAMSHYVNVEASLQSPDTQAGREIQSNLPHLRDAIIRDLYRNPLTAARGAKVDDAVLKQRILAAARQIVGEDVVEDVLLINVIRTRM